MHRGAFCQAGQVGEDFSEEAETTDCLVLLDPEGPSCSAGSLRCTGMLGAGLLHDLAVRLRDPQASLGWEEECTEPLLGLC